MCSTTSSSVHGLETIGQHVDGINLPVQDWTPNLDHSRCESVEEDRTFRHSGWQTTRAKVWTALNHVSASNNRKLAFWHCGGMLRAEHCGDELRLRAFKCHDRFCLACARERAGVIAAAIKELAQFRNCRMITLTLRHTDTPLYEQIARLKRCFKELRRRLEWNDHVVGGVSFLECKLSERDGLWHVHLHIIAEGVYWEQKSLSRLWYMVTGDSSIVDIGQHNTPEAMARYAAKYCTKPLHSSVYNNFDRLCEFVLSLKGIRLYDLFGSWRKLDLEPEKTPTAGWEPLGSPWELRRRATAGDATAQRWWEALLRKWPSLGGEPGPAP